MMVSEAIRHILALSFFKSEQYGQIHIVSGLSGQVLTIGQCPRPGGSSLTITMTCDTLNCSRNVSWDQLEQFKSILSLPWRTRAPRPSQQKGNSIAQPGVPSLLERDLDLIRTANIKLPPPSVRSRAPHTKSLMILEKKLNIRSKLVNTASLFVIKMWTKLFVPDLVFVRPLYWNNDTGYKIYTNKSKNNLYLQSIEL